MPAIYGETPTPRSSSLSATDTPRLLTEELPLSLRPTGGLQFSTPSTEQADTWACSLLNLSPDITQCDHTDISCACWQDDPTTYSTLFFHEPISLSHSQAPQTNRLPFPSTPFTESSSSSSRSGSVPSTNYERSSEIRTRGTSYASGEDVERSINKP